MHDVVLIAIPPRRVTHLPTGDVGTVLGVDADGYLVVKFDGSRYPTSLQDHVLTDATAAAEVASAARWSESLILDAEQTGDWLERAEVARQERAAGRVQHWCQWCDGEVWVMPEDLSDPARVSCRPCRYKDGA